MHEVLTQLALLQAEVQQCAPSQINRVMRPMAEYVFSVLKEEAKKAHTLGLTAVLQVYLDLSFLERAI